MRIERFFFAFISREYSPWTFAEGLLRLLRFSFAPDHAGVVMILEVVA